MADEPNRTCDQRWRSDQSKACKAVALPGDHRCLAHTDEKSRRDFLSTISGWTYSPNKFRRLEISPELVSTIRQDVIEYPVDFTAAIFTGDADFKGVKFSRGARFEDVTFGGNANFQSAVFIDQANFDGAAFTDDANFILAKLASANFNFAKFEGGAVFSNATFTDDAYFNEATFVHGAAFEWAVFSDVHFDRTTFAHHVDFIETTFGKNIDFSSRPEILGDAEGEHECPANLTGAVFEGTSRIELGRPLVLTNVVLQAPLTIKNAGHGAAIVSLEGVTLEAPLVVGAGVGLGACGLSEATGLDQLRLVGADPGWVVYRGRRVLADELRLRAVRGDDSARFWARVNGIALAGRYERYTAPETVEAAYRQLRAALESSKAAPAAADFYYGEMEMRRLATRRLSGERLLLLIYKATCGYGLRASRALATYVAVMVVATAGFRYRTRWFVQTPTKVGGGEVNFRHWWEVFFKLVARSSVSFFSPIDTSGLHTTGVALLLLLRFTGPTFLALAVLAIRAKVQR